MPIPSAATRLLPSGYAVASIDYRLSGTAIWPAQIHDCKAAIRHLRANASTYGLDPDRIAVMGSSAGGHLVAALATMGDVAAIRRGTFVVDLEGTVGTHLGTSSRVQACVDQFGPTNMLHSRDFPGLNHDGAGSPESLLVGGGIQTVPKRWTTVDPIPFLSPDDAPMLVMHEANDTVVPFHQSQMLLDAATAMATTRRCSRCRTMVTAARASSHPRQRRPSIPSSTADCATCPRLSSAQSPAMPVLTRTAMRRRSWCRARAARLRR